MILTKTQSTESVVTQIGIVDDSMRMSLDMDSAQSLIQMLSKNLYSDAVGSTVRETVSNAIDSMRRAGNNNPVVVSIRRNQSNEYEFSVKDEGIGLDDDDFRNIISKYGKSTKKEIANEIGAFGLGLKSPMAYTSSFMLVCRKKGIERKYMMYEDEEGSSIDLLYSQETSENNGVEVIVPIKRGDYSEFLNKTKEQLAYFENVYFDVPEISNDFKIYRGEGFQLSELCHDYNLHLCLDDVYYPLDFAKLGISPIRTSLALRFSLSDGVYPIPNRESIRYSPEAKRIIMDKIKEVADVCISTFNESVKETEDFDEVVKYYEGSRILKIGSFNVNINDISKYSSLSFGDIKMKGVEHLNLKYLVGMKYSLMREYSIHHKMGHRGKIGKYTYPLQYNTKGFLLETNLSINLRNYLNENKELFEGREYIVKKGLKRRLYGGTGYYTVLQLSSHPKSMWRTLIREMQHIESLIFKKNISNTPTIPQEWLDARKKVKSSTYTGTGRRKVAGEFNCKILVKTMRGDNYAKLVPLICDVATFYKQNYLFVYSLSEKREKLDNYFNIFNKQRVKFIIVSEREKKLLDGLNIHNLTSFENFMKGEYKALRRMITCLRIMQMTEGTLKNLFHHSDRLHKVSPYLEKLMKKISDYVSDNTSYKYYSHAEVVDLLKLGQDNNFYDGTIEASVKEMESYIPKLQLMDTLFSNIRYSMNDDQEKMYNEIFYILMKNEKFTKIKLNK